MEQPIDTLRVYVRESRQIQGFPIIKMSHGIRPKITKPYIRKKKNKNNKNRIFICL